MPAQVQLNVNATVRGNDANSSFKNSCVLATERPYNKFAVQVMVSFLRGQAGCVRWLGGGAVIPLVVGWALRLILVLAAQPDDPHHGLPRACDAGARSRWC
jgi:hypothetical protein